MARIPETLEFERSCEVTILRVGNGFVVYSNDLRNGTRKALVFNELGYGQTMSDDPRATSLLAWITQHFSDK
jgi:hypothetical protein